MVEENLTKDIKTPSNDLMFLKKHFSHCFDKDSNFNFDKFKQELSKNEDLEFSKESYGMGWLGKSYARLLASNEATTLLKEDEEFNQREENKKSENLLLKWDNLEILKHLSNAYYEKVKMIYIDPPYNTGSDGFVYQDERKFTIEELSQLAGINEKKSKRILEFTQSKSNSHSAWLTFMYPRLYIAKRLLRDEGVVFVSIDDNEVAQLRLLMDEIFGEENFVGEFIWHKKLTGGYDNDNINTKHEKIFIYANDKDSFEMNYVKTESNYKLIDENGKKYKWDSLWNVGGLTYSKSLDYPIKAPDGTDIYPIGEKGVAFWLWSKDKVEKDRDLLNFKKDKNGLWKVYKKIYASDSLVPSSLLDKDVVGGNTNSSREMKNLFGVKPFDYAKPSSLIKFLIERGANQDSIILDFFAGSGTTADAVMQLNTEDWGNRKYIMVQLPEEIDKKKNKTAFDFVKDELKVEESTIFEITKERIIRSKKKIVKDNEASKDRKDLSKQDFGFKIFETIPNDEWVWEDYNFQSEEFDSQVKLFNESNLKDSDLKTLLTTWKTNDNIPLTESLKEIDLYGYKWYYFDTKLYLVNTGFQTKNLKKLLEEIDNNKDFNPASIIVFGYNFESKSLREIAENIKSYANKKHIDIDFITRY